MRDAVAANFLGMEATRISYGEQSETVRAIRRREMQEDCFDWCCEVWYGGNVSAWNFQLALAFAVGGKE